MFNDVMSTVNEAIVSISKIQPLKVAFSPYNKCKEDIRLYIQYSTYEFNVGRSKR